MLKQSLILVLSIQVLMQPITAFAHNDASQSGMIAACERLVHSYAIHRDSLDAQAYGALFTKDATLSLAGKTTKGRENIINSLIKRASKSMNRHLTGSVVVKPLSKNEASGISYVMVFKADPEEASPKALTNSSFFGFATYRDIFSYTQGKCLIKQRTITIDFLNKE